MIELDINSLVQDLKLTKGELDEVRELVVKAYVDEAYIQTVALAKNTLGSTKNDYISALSINKVNKYTYELVLDSTGNPIAGMLENGCSAFDLKIGFSKSPKIHSTKNGGWYLTIPMLFRTTNAVEKSGAPGQILPRSIYDLIRNSPSTKRDTGTTVTSTLSGDDVPAKYQPGQLMGVNKVADQYLPKNSIYAGLIRKQDKATGMSKYNTFRRVSNNSDPRSWMHPGLPAYNLMDKAAATVEQLDIAETALQKFFPSATIKVRVYGQLALEMNANYNKTLSEMTVSIGEQIKNMLTK